MTDLKNYVNDTAIMLASTWQAINHIESESDKLEVVQTLLNYSFTGILQKSNNPIVNMVITQALPNINAAQQRYDYQCGKKAAEPNNNGGRPREINYEKIMRYRDCGHSYGTIANITGVNINTIKSIVNREKNSHLSTQEGCKPMGLQPLNKENKKNVDKENKTNIGIDADNAAEVEEKIDFGEVVCSTSSQGTQPSNISLNDKIQDKIASLISEFGNESAENIKKSIEDLGEYDSLSNEDMEKYWKGLCFLEKKMRVRRKWREDAKYATANDMPF